MHRATIDWRRSKWSGMRGKHSRDYLWHLAGGAKLKASDAVAPARVQ
jgi:hypothetical protein